MALGSLWPWEQTAGLDLPGLHPSCAGGRELGTGQLQGGVGSWGAVRLAGQGAAAFPQPEATPGL